MYEIENTTFWDIGKMTLLMGSGSGCGLSWTINGTRVQKSKKYLKMFEMFEKMLKMFEQNLKKQTLVPLNIASSAAILSYLGNSVYCLLVPLSDS